MISCIDVMLVEHFGSSDLVKADSEDIFILIHHIGNVGLLLIGKLLSKAVCMFVTVDCVLMFEVHLLFEVLLHCVDTRGAKTLLSSLCGFQLRNFFQGFGEYRNEGDLGNMVVGLNLEFVIGLVVKDDFDRASVG